MKIKKRKLKTYAEEEVIPDETMELDRESITSSHYILFLCNFMALLKRLICPAVANEPTTDMMFLSSTS